jgi:hypothetical protein
MEVAANGTADAWRERITSQQASGQSIRVWCRENNHHEHAFYWWRARLGLSPKSAAKRTQRRPLKPLRFAEVVVHRAAAEPMRLRLGGGRELHLPASMAIESVAKLVRAIEGQA